jgi:hypothetical protein
VRFEFDISGHATATSGDALEEFLHGMLAIIRERAASEGIEIVPEDDSGAIPGTVGWREIA